MFSSRELSGNGLIHELLDVLRKSKASQIMTIENEIAVQTLDKFVGVEVAEVLEPKSNGINLFTKGLFADYAEVLNDNEQLRESVTTFSDTIIKEITEEEEKIKAFYENLSLNLDEDPMLVAANAEERGLIEEALTFLKFDLVEEEDGKKLKPNYFDRNSLPTTINVGIKNLVADYSEKSLRRPVIRKVLELVNYRANS